MADAIELDLRALVFDVFGTVVDWRSGVISEVTEFARRHALTTIDPAAFADVWRSHYSPSMEEVRSADAPLQGWMCCTGRVWRKRWQRLERRPPACLRMP